MKESNELFELCKQVYEATGWDGLKEIWVTTLNGKKFYVETSRGYQNEGFPLYTSDYILEKLPKESEEIGYLDLCSDGDNWMARYTKLSATMVHQKSNTPLKALLKLTIKLYDEKML